MATKTKKESTKELLIGSPEWYEANRELYTNELSERYYDLPLSALMTLVHNWEKEEGSTLTWQSELVSLETSWVVVKLSFMIGDTLDSSVLGSAANIANPMTGDVSPVVTAQNQAIRSFLKKKFTFCNLPKELSVVEEEQKVVVDESDIDLPIKPKKTKTVKIDLKVDAKDESSEQETLVEETKEVTTNEVVSENETAPKTTKVTSSEDPGDYVIKINRPDLDGKTLNEISDLPTGPAFLQYYASHVNDERFVKFKDLCEACVRFLQKHDVQKSSKH